MYSKKVKEFSKACGEIAPKPVFLNKEKIDFLFQMVKDEFEELKVAKDGAEQADALVDMIYYVIDTAVKNGYNLDPVFDIVHQANMNKVINGKVTRRADGKILKPLGWTSPDRLIAKEIEKQSKSS